MKIEEQQRKLYSLKGFLFFSNIANIDSRKWAITNVIFALSATARAV